MTHICVGNLTIIGSDNGLSPDRRQTIIWTNVGISLIDPLGTNFSEIVIEIHTFPFKKIHLKMPSGKWRPSCLGLNVLTRSCGIRPYEKWVTALLIRCAAASLTVHYCDVIMGAMTSQITSLANVYSTFHSGADQRKHQSSASLAFVRGIHRWPVNSPHKWPVSRKMFPFDDGIMALWKL